MRPVEPVMAAGWKATLALGFVRRGARTVLASRRHDGPLVVQKALYPEGEAVCHAILVHPPAGIAGGDQLVFEVSLDRAACALLTTPGAGKWYRSAGLLARQSLQFDVAPGAVLEWLPQETIVFDGARAELRSDVRLAHDACFIGWEVLCLGRTGSGERFTHGECRLDTRIVRDGRCVWLDRGQLDGGGALLAAASGLDGQPVCGTMVALGPGLDAALVAACRQHVPARGTVGVTLLPDVLVARYLGTSGEAAREYFTALWRVLRPALAGRDAVEPRIWRT